MTKAASSPGIIKIAAMFVKTTFKDLKELQIMD